MYPLTLCHAALALAIACATACAFDDPAKLPDAPTDPCQEGPGDPDVIYTSYAENPAFTCGDDELPAGALNSLLYFTGPGWSQTGAECRTQDPFHGGLMVGRTTPVTTTRIPTTGAIAYCVVGPGSATEYVMFSQCGILDPAEAGCQLLSDMSGIPTEFQLCPGGPLCP